MAPTDYIAKKIEGFIVLYLYFLEKIRFNFLKSYLID